MNETKGTVLAIQLDPRSSRRLVRAVEERRRARGWRRADLARNTQSGISSAVLDQWAYQANTGKALRLDLDKALDLLAAVGVAANGVDELIARLADSVASLIEEAADVPQVAS